MGKKTRSKSCYFTEKYVFRKKKIKYVSSPYSILDNLHWDSGRNSTHDFVLAPNIGWYILQHNEQIISAKGILCRDPTSNIDLLWSLCFFSLAAAIKLQCNRFVGTTFIEETRKLRVAFWQTLQTKMKKSVSSH